MSITTAWWAGLNLILMLLFLALSIYSFTLFIKLAHRGIKALDIYIKKNS